MLGRDTVDDIIKLIQSIQSSGEDAAVSRPPARPPAHTLGRNGGTGLLSVQFGVTASIRLLGRQRRGMRQGCLRPPAQAHAPRAIVWWRVLAAATPVENPMEKNPSRSCFANTLWRVRRRVRRREARAGRSSCRPTSSSRPGSRTGRATCSAAAAGPGSATTAGSGRRPGRTTARPPPRRVKATTWLPRRTCCTSRGRCPW